MKKYSLLVFLILILIGCSTEEITEEPLDVEESVLPKQQKTLNQFKLTKIYCGQKESVSRLKNLYQIGIN